ncbi:MAG: hypothetical protein HYX33_03470 [Actinobacteria bacterium]|nr:hypothetical protein [Actinomycetota bacterium]
MSDRKPIADPASEADRSIDRSELTWRDFRASRERFLKRLHAQHEIHNLERAWAAPTAGVHDDPTSRARS